MIRKLLRFLTSRFALIVLLIFIQLYIVLQFFGGLPQQVDIVLSFVGFFIVMHLVNSNQNQSISVAWIIIVLLFPGIGALVYLMFAKRKVPKGLRNLNEQTNIKAEKLLPQDLAIIERIKEEDFNVYKQFNYVLKNSAFPVYDNTQVDYYPVGEAKFEAMLVELKKAKKYIFLEYFIVREGVMWNSILDILVEKVKEGVDVRVMYDDFGTISNLPKNYHHKLAEYGIKVHIFNRLRPLLLVRMNHRDHRKILTIDGKVGFLGGINLGDEYVNQFERFGHWKDSAIKLEGEAVWSLTLMFLQFWNSVYEIDEELSQYNPNYKVKAQGLVQPYSDSPTDMETLGENIHLNIINNAKHYLYIMTPYFIPSYEMMRMLILSKKNGVDVRVIVPHKPDKWYVHAITKSNYRELVENKIRVFEYTPGFIHSKNLLADDKMGVVGSANIDFRSYYLNFESGALMYESDAIDSMKMDFITTFSESIEITIEDVNSVPLHKKFIRSFLGLFSPLL